MNKPYPIMIQKIAQKIYDKKGFNIIGIDVRGLSTLTDYFLIAEGSVERHVIALYWDIRKELKNAGIEILQVEGESLGDWIVLDCGGLIIHLFVPELREKYRLEELWGEGKVLELNLEIKNIQYSPKTGVDYE